MSAKPKLRVVGDEEIERVFGSRDFISRTRNPALRSPIRFEPTPKKPEDIVI